MDKAFENEINSEDFNKQFFELSKEINFFHQFSRIYAKMFINDNEWHEIFVSLLFQTKYEQDENDIINSISYLVNNSLNERFKYEVLLKK